MNTIVRLLVMLLLAAPALAQDQAPPAETPRPGERLRKVFAERLRQELQLTDAQAAEVVPKIEAIERIRREGRREKAVSARELRTALRVGAPDAEIDKILARVDASEVERESEVRARMKEVDAALSSRQRAELRFFVAKFRREVDRRIRGEAGPMRQRERMPMRRPVAPAPEAP
ncbi:MAG TPA: hypothetical protein VF139_16595 [Candidatus Polarisedimenticolaceae bacterium]